MANIIMPPTFHGAYSATALQKLSPGYVPPPPSFQTECMCEPIPHPDVTHPDPLGLTKDFDTALATIGDKIDALIAPPKCKPVKHKVKEKVCKRDLGTRLLDL